MKNAPPPETTEELLGILKQISSLIEDNNQNIKDCYKVISKIEKRINTKQNSKILSGIKKLLNRK